MEKIQNFKKLTTDELKLIKGSGSKVEDPPPPCPNCGGTNNPGSGSNKNVTFNFQSTIQSLVKSEDDV